MRVLIACEFSGIVRDAFIELGHDAISCDLLPSEQPGPHIVGDVSEILNQGWGMMIAFPPCTHLCASGARWWSKKERVQKEALAFVEKLMNAPIEKIVIENPVGKIGSAIRKSDQIIQPWQFGHGETKATCLWLKGLPKLMPTEVVNGRQARVHRASQNSERWKERSRTLRGIAKAMAEQWGTTGLNPGDTEKE